MEEKLFNALVSIGLHKNEALVYLDLVKFGTSLPKDITKRTQIHRVNVYDALKKLQELGFIEEILGLKKRYFKPFPPKTISHYLRQIESEIEGSVESLQYSGKNGADEDKISIMKGVPAARATLLELLDLNSEIISFGVPSNVRDIIGEGFYTEEFHKVRVKRKIPIRVIFCEAADRIVDQINKMGSSEARSSGMKCHSHTYISICGDELITIILSSPVNVIKIHNKEIAQVYKDYFEVLWKNSKRYKCD